MEWTTAMEAADDKVDGVERAKPMGIVIPGFGHPKFLAEAIVSACNQDIDCKLYIVVVDDGCKFPETAETVRDLMQIYPGKLFYFRQKNTRLPGARNAGVQFLMQLDDTIEAIYFLDADNRLSPFSLRVFRDALGNDPAVGWAYPDIGFFGLTWGQHGVDTRETAPTYSVFKHLVANISEAGSLVRTDMFRRGVFFDETMRSGFEDWDFWLTAIAVGFKGTRAVNSGFRYRRRSESMLAEARREADALMGRIQSKHSRLFSSDFIAACENEEAPAFAVMITDADQVHLFSDPLAALTTVDRIEFDHMVVKWLVNDQEHFFPPYILTMSEASWQAWCKRKYFARSLFWHLRNHARGFEYYRVEAGDRFRVMFDASAADLCRTASFGMITSQLLRKLIHSDLECERDFIGKPRRNLVQVPELPNNLGTIQEGEMPEYPEAIETVAEKDFRDRVLSLLRHHRGFKKPLQNMDRRFAGPQANEVRRKLMPITFGETSVYEPYVCATSQKARLFIASNPDCLKDDQYDAFIKLLDLSKGCFDEVMIGLDYEKQLDLKASRIPVGDYPNISDICAHQRIDVPEEYCIYLERKLKFYFQYENVYSSSLMMQNAGTVILLGDTAYLEVHGEARKNGAVGYLWLEERFFEGPEKLDHAIHKALAFEHALQAIMTDSDMIRDKLNAYGVPADKVKTTDQILAMVFTEDD